MPLLIVLVIVLIGVVLLLKKKPAKAVEALENERILLNICHGNRELFERLLACELEKPSVISRPAAVKSAILAYQRDNR